MDDLDLGATIKGFIPGQKLFNRYTLHKILGRGGMGVVWLARDEELEREVALKFLPEIVALDNEAVRDLKRETRRSLELTHPHIVRIYDFIQDARTAAIAMEYVDGATLAARKVEHPQGCFEAVELGAWIGQWLEAMEYAHAQAKVVHRDLKPANLMIDGQGWLKVADFGISASMSDTASRVSNQFGSSGTPVYMSPQQMMGEKPAVTDDIYAIGATLYELLTGKPPFYSGNVLLQVQNRVPLTVTERRAELGVTGEPIPPEWEATIAACLAKEPKDRPQSAGEVLERLGLTTKSTSAFAKASADRKDTKPQAKVERLVPQPLKTQAPDGSGASRPTSKVPLVAGLVAGVVLFVGLGWYFGIHVPEQKRLAEVARLKSEQEQTEQKRLAEAAERKAEQEKEEARLAAEAAAERARHGTLGASLMAELAELKVRWDIHEREERDAERRLADLRAELRALRDPAPGAVNALTARIEASQGYHAWLRDYLLRHPFRILQVRAEQFISSRAFNEAAEVMPELRIAIANIGQEIDHERTRRFLITGAARVDSSPSGLSYELIDAYGRIHQGVTPVVLNDLGGGIARLTVTRTGWPAQESTVTILPGETVEKTIQFASGGLELAITPAEATIWRGEQQVGTGRLVWPEAVPGDYDFEVRAPDFHSRRLTVRVMAGQTENQKVTLERIPHFRIPDLDVEMRWIPAGTFVMGSETGEADEQPLTRVTFTRPFWLASVETTQGMWAVYARSLTGRSEVRHHERWVKLLSSTPNWQNLPVVMVPGFDAVNFLNWLNQREAAAGRLPDGYVYTLPSEAEWEYACRAGTTGDYHGPLDSVAWHPRNAGGERRAVAQKQPNAWGLYDMHGNVWELTRSRSATMGPLPRYPGGSVTDYHGQSNGDWSIRRGGGWSAIPNPFELCRAANRGAIGNNSMTTDTGFRIALVPAR